MRHSIWVEVSLIMHLKYVSYSIYCENVASVNIYIYMYMCIYMYIYIYVYICI